MISGKAEKQQQPTGPRHRPLRRMQIIAATPRRLAYACATRRVALGDPARRETSSCGAIEGYQERRHLSERVQKSAKDCSQTARRRANGEQRCTPKHCPGTVNTRSVVDCGAGGVHSARALVERRAHRVQQSLHTELGSCSVSNPWPCGRFVRKAE